MGHLSDITMEDSIVSRTATVRARIAPGLKADVEKLLDRLGMTTTEAITLFYSQIRLRQGLPFPVELPNETTRKTFEATDRGEDLSTHDSIDKMFAALDKC
jgi:DNA-damage-inducible protein J